MHRRPGKGCKFAMVVDGENFTFECPVFDVELGCPIDDCPGRDDPRFCPVCGTIRAGIRVGDKAILVCKNYHNHKMFLRDWNRRLAKVTTGA